MFALAEAYFRQFRKDYREHVVLNIVHTVTYGDRIEIRDHFKWNLNTCLFSKFPLHRRYKFLITVPFPRRQAPGVPIRLVLMPMQ